MDTVIDGLAQYALPPVCSIQRCETEHTAEVLNLCAFETQYDVQAYREIEFAQLSLLHCIVKD